MPALVPTEFFAKIVWLGCVSDRNATLASDSRETLSASFAGLAEEEHSGLTRPSCSRVISQYPRGTEIRNTRQFSIVSIEELSEISEAMGIDRLTPSAVGASVAVEGIPDFSHIPPSSRLQAESGLTLTVDMQNRPCHLPAKVIDADFPGKGGAFKASAQGRRGITAWVEREGTLTIGEALRLHIPDQRAWLHKDP